ncbi:endolytic transglycosylase MltG [Candidatus Saccharibacteria bacterium]|nr:endolytic transglycosylase MltG [Candidatus Saccharibacteria bacterium]
MKIIGLDVGEKRIGVAKADDSIRIATPIGFFNVDGTEWEMIDRIAKMNNTNVFVLGLPRSNEGNETQQSVYVRQFAKKLTEKIPGARVRFQDESLTSVQAEERLKMRKKAYEKGDIDAEAATIILQDYVESYRPEEPKPEPVEETAPLIPGMKAAPVVAAAPTPTPTPAPAPAPDPTQKVKAPEPVDVDNKTFEKELEKKLDAAVPKEEVAEESKNPVVVAAKQIKDKTEKLADNTKAAAKREGEKVALNAKKAEQKVKKFSKKIIILPPLIIAIIVLCVGGGLFIKKKLDDRAAYEAWVREEESKKAKEFEFEVKPGETIFDVKKNFASYKCNKDPLDPEKKEKCFTDEQIEEAFDSSIYGKSFIPNGVSLEGFLMPEKFRCFENGVDNPVQACIERFLNHTSDFIQNNNLEMKYAERGFSLYEGIILASVIQKEARSQDMPTVSQVFQTRLNYGIPLGSDVTVSYALDVVDPDRTTYKDNQAALQIDSCYNTRKNAGLPCGPISMPGGNALMAVANPTDSTYLYFLTGDDGVMYYSYTEYEHNQNIYLHCQVLCNVSL